MNITFIFVIASIRLFILFSIFFNCYLAAPRPNLSHYRGGSLTHPMLITFLLHIRPEGHREPRSEIGSLGPAKRLVGFEPGTFRFWSQRLSPLDHSPYAWNACDVLKVNFSLCKIEKHQLKGMVKKTQDTISKNH